MHPSLPFGAKKHTNTRTSRPSFSFARRLAAPPVAAALWLFLGSLLGSFLVLTFFGAPSGGHLLVRSETLAGLSSFDYSNDNDPSVRRSLRGRARGFRSWICASDGAKVGGYGTESNSGVQPPPRIRVLGIVGIITGFDSGSRRESLRKTWMASSPETLNQLQQSTGLHFRFILGQTRDRSKEVAVQREVSVYNDFIRLQIEEHYNSLNQKTLAFLREVHRMYDADFYVKADDDIYLRPDRLSLLISHQRQSKRVYIGCMKRGPVISDPGLKWFEPDAYMLGNEYFLHAYGPIYALSQEVVASLVVAKPGSLRMFINEDVSVGSWMLAFNVTYEDNRSLCEPECRPNSIAVWDIPRCSGLCNSPARLLELHEQEMCSRSPAVS